MKTIFVVDDSDTNLAKAEEALEIRYRAMTLPSAAKMFGMLEKVRPDLILLDIEMPEIDGFEALQRLKAHQSYMDIPVIFLTARTDSAVEAQGFDLGVVDFITKPFSTSVLLNRIKTHLETDEIIREQTMHLRRLQNSIISVLANMIENRDKVSDGHLERTAAYVKILITGMKELGVYADELCQWDLETTISSVRLYDVGKIAVSDMILNKHGKLTEDEYGKMKIHTLEGERIVDQIVASTGEEEFLHNAKLFAGYHHERWDGSGYPYGLKETEIPLQGRIMAIVDVYDALMSERPYKGAFADDIVISIITSESGKYFDPKIVEVFLQMQKQFKETEQKLS